MTAIYPKREPYFAHRFIRLMTKTAIAMEVGTEGFALLTVIAMQEDACRYTKPVAFWNSQLLILLGVDPLQEARLRRIREKCVSLGWLSYSPGAKGRPAHYYVIIPDAVSSIEDGPCDESAQESVTHSAEVRRECDENATRMRRESDNIHTSPSPLSITCKTAHDPVFDQMENIMQADQSTTAQVAAEPMKISWLDWRRDHPLVGIGMTGSDGDTSAWRDLFATYGPECLDPMYVALIKNIEKNKKIWYSMAIDWLHKNTKAVE